MSSSRAIVFPPKELDKISELPDDILVKIISAMDLQNAVQASVLAKRWRYLWTWRIDLNLHRDNMSQYKSVSENIRPEEYFTWVNHVIDAHQAPCIRKLTLWSRIKFDNRLAEKWVRLAEKWVRFAFSKRVEELDLRFGSRSGNPIFSMGFNILQQSLINGIFNLKSLRMLSVNVSGEDIEYILLKSPLLELLCVENSKTLHTLHILSDKLKHLTLMRCSHLKKLEIDAVNLISFNLFEPDGAEHFFSPITAYMPHIVFKRVPKLVQVYFTGRGFFRPFHLLKQITPISNQLTKLSFHSKAMRLDDFSADYFDTVKKDLIFWNVKHITMEMFNLTPLTIAFTKFFIDVHVCPKLHGFKLQIDTGAIPAPFEFSVQRAVNQAKLLCEKSDKVAMDICMPVYVIKAIDPFHCEFLWDYYGDPKVRYKNQCHSNLKVLEISNDVEFALDIIACADSFETLICTRRYSDLRQKWVQTYDADFATYYDPISIRVRNLARVLAHRRIHVGIRDDDSTHLFWVS